MSGGVVYAGSFDPITNGHIDLIERAARMFNEVTCAIAHNYRKGALFSIDERIAHIEEATAHIPGVRTDHFTGLLVDYMRNVQVDVVVRGLRAMSDFEFEMQMALTNRKMSPNFEAVFLMTHQNYSYLSSSLVKEIAEFGGDVSEFVPPCVHEALAAKFAAPSTST